MGRAAAATLFGPVEPPRAPFARALRHPSESTVR